MDSLQETRPREVRGSQKGFCSRLGLTAGLPDDRKRHLPLFVPKVFFFCYSHGKLLQEMGKAKVLQLENTAKVLS
jgi:hypothetical protein